MAQAMKKERERQKCGQWDLKSARTLIFIMRMHPHILPASF